MVEMLGRNFLRSHSILLLLLPFLQLSRCSEGLSHPGRCLEVVPQSQWVVVFVVLLKHTTQSRFFQCDLANKSVKLKCKNLLSMASIYPFGGPLRKLDSINKQTLTFFSFHGEKCTQDRRIYSSHKPENAVLAYICSYFCNLLH